MLYVMPVLLLLWSVANLVFAFVEPPPALARFVPRKVWFLFAMFPEPWDRRLGMLFNAGLGMLGIAFWTYYVILSS